MSNSRKSISAKTRILKKILLSTLKISAKISLRLISYMVVAMCVLYISAKAPEIHGSLIRTFVGEKVYTIRDIVDGPGGTGFSVAAPSGKTYIVTTAHVCGVSSDKTTILVNTEDGRHIRRKILEVSNKSDLCLIEGLDGVKGLKVGPEPKIGQIIAAVGHPSLMPITISRGELIGTTDIPIARGVIDDFPPSGPDGSSARSMVNPSALIDPKDCRAPKNKIIKQIANFGFIQVEFNLCLEVTKDAYLTNMLIQPGSSGSPVVDFWGNVVGVAFASDSYSWGSAVSLHDLKELLSNR